MLAPAQLDAVLATVEQQTIDSSIALLRGRVRVSPAAFGVAESTEGQPTMVMIPILDLHQRFRTLRQAAEQSKIEGFVFVFDGVLKGLDGAHDAILVVTCTRLSRRAQAVPYRHTVEGLHVGDPLVAPDEIAAEYQRVLDVHPQPHSARQQ